MVDQTAAESGQIGAGQQDPLDSVSDFAVTSFIVRQMMALMETMTPVKVVSVSPGAGSPPKAGTVDVQILVSQIDGAGNSSKPGIVHGVPYFRLGGGPWAIVCDPAVGDFGFIVAASRDVSNVNKNPGIQVPASLRKYSYSDAYYLGGVLNGAPEASIWLKADGTFKLIDKVGNMIQTSSSGITVTPKSGQPLTVDGAVVITGNLELQGAILSQTGSTYAGNIRTTGTITGDTDVIAGTISGKNHVHTDPQGGNTGPPV